MESKKGRGKQGKQLDTAERLKYLHRAALWWSGLSGGGGASVARRYNAIQKQLSRKQQVRIPPSSKRTICKGCDSSIYHAHDATVRIRGKSHQLTLFLKTLFLTCSWFQGSRSKHVVMTCKTCGRIKRFPIGTRAPKKTSTKQIENQQTHQTDAKSQIESQPESN